MNKTIKMSDEWERIYFNEFRTKKWLSLFGFIICSGKNSDFHYTGKWFKMIEIKQQKVKDRYKDFDSGWNYSSYWKSWKESWVLVDIIN